MTRPMSVLLTGFGPFDEHRINPTEVLVRAYYPERLGLPPNGLGLERMVLPVDTTAPDVLERALDRDRFEVVLHLGLHERADALRVERQARNIMDFRIPDNRGLRISGEPVVPGGPACLPTTWPVDRIVDALTNAGLPALASDSAGGYVCNMVLYRSLHLHRSSGREAVVGFLHVPPPDVLPPPALILATDAVLGVCLDVAAERRANGGGNDKKSGGCTAAQTEGGAAGEWRGE